MNQHVSASPFQSWSSRTATKEQSDSSSHPTPRRQARDLEVTPGALYRYVKSRDDLLTLLIVDAYESLGKAVEEAEGRIPRGDHEGRWVALWHATRTWALEHRNEYGLIYGARLPGPTGDHPGRVPDLDPACPDRLGPEVAGGDDAAAGLTGTGPGAAGGPREGASLDR